MDGKISLREAIFYAEAYATLGGTITFAPSLKGQTITLSGTELAVSQGIVMDATSLYDALTQTLVLPSTQTAKAESFT